MLNVEAAALRADGDYRDRQQERALRGRSTVNLNACKGKGKVEQVNAKMTVTMKETSYRW